MGMLLLAAFIGVPMIEIAVFIQVGGLIGLWPTLGLVLLSAVIGTWQLRAQGFATLQRARQQIDRGVVPTRELFDGMCLLLAGALLLTPGFVTDTVGLLLFVPMLRDALRRQLARHLKTSTEVWAQGEARRPGRQPGQVIDVEYREVTPDDGDADEDQPKGPQR